jgi:regulator of sigma E protease
MFFTIIIFFFILGLLVFVHELGHFIAARRNGVAVHEFGFGFPPRIFGIKRGETIYSINWIPLGGFVKIKGENGENREEEDSFGNKKVWQRALILAAGVLMNFVLAAVLLGIGFTVGMPEVINGQSGLAKIRDTKIEIVQILDGSPASNAELSPGDEIISIDGQKIDTINSIQEYIDAKAQSLIKVTVLRNGEILEKEITPVILEATGKGGIGIGLLKSGIVSYPWYIAPWKGLEGAVFFTKEILLAFYDLIKNLIVAQKVAVELSGPVGIAVLTGQVARMGFAYVIQFTALLSLNLAVINFLPFPALDGGRILFLIIEKIKRRPVNQKIENVVHNIGFLLLMCLIVLVTYRDIAKFGYGFVSLWNKIVG